MVRAEVIRERLDVLLDALSDLRRYRDSVTQDDLRSDRDKQHMVLHAMYVAVQAAIDLALHAVADAEAPLGPTYRQAFRPLADAASSSATSPTGWRDGRACATCSRITTRASIMTSSTPR